MEDRVLDVFRAAAADRCRGAAEIELELIDRLLRVRSDWQIDRLVAGFDLLARSHPGMANLSALADSLSTGGELVSFDTSIADRRRMLARLPKVLAANAAPLLSGCRRVVTVSKSTAVAAVVEGMAESGWHGEIIVLDGSATGRGADQAELLLETGLLVRSQPDATTPTWLHGEPSGIRVLVGADAVTDRFFVNALGTLLLFELAERRSISRLVVADSAKQADAAQVESTLRRMEPVKEEGPARLWSVMEKVPSALIGAWISERGVLTEAPWNWSAA
jgi:translation initiation factor 2B subunit (eIF-2B alpha/beta/delta family)